MKEFDRLMQDLRALADDADALLRHAVRDAGDGYDQARARLDAQVKDARKAMSDLEESVRRGAARSTEEALEYAREHPWHLIGAGIGLGVLAALLLGGRRRD